ncbi:MAG: tRNA preQ1(34) S-adenosylmethionine ribosyltransferase-isomerase QueA [Candidatus Omnitrophica bacterium]|nr:tRNA preQ1(34) S-adenosylmethionine ribosyltransferase-isomerase QueA [Candidatus Omnitrophota bacterium]
MKKANWKLSDFDYYLPKELIAQYPSPNRDQARLLVLERARNILTHRQFSDIVDYLSSGDTLVLNDTKVVPARMIGRREQFSPDQGGGKQEIFLLAQLDNNRYQVLARPAGKLSVGAKIFFDEDDVSALVLSDQGMSKVIEFSANGRAQNIWQRLGQVPLPPYIKREPQMLDKKRYQTVYARSSGATAAPTAGLHFTKKILRALAAKGVNIVYLTLHINYGTFQPVKCADITQHKMHREYFVLPRKTLDTVQATKARGNKVFAVGTTSVRVLETCAQAKEGWTDLFIYPPYKFKVVDSLFTNFHFPKSTLLMLVSAFAGKELLFKAYQEAIARRYRFFSYGDCMLIL